MPANRNALRRVLSKTPRASNKLPAGPLLGVNLGNIAAASDVTDYEAWLGKSVDSVNLHTGRNGWTDYVDSIGYVGGLYSAVDRPRHWSIPLFEANAGTLALAASGAYDSYWIAAAKAVLANAYPTTGPIPVRTGWEMNLAGQPWYCYGNEANYVTAFRRFVDCFRSVSSRFAFVWCPNFETFDGGNVVDVELVYPGKNYVDIISMDFYVFFGTGGFNGDPAGAISYYFGGDATTGRRLNWLVSFAKRMGKPVAIDEWGVSSDGFETYIDYAADFFTTNGFYYSKWWEEESAYDSFLSDGSYATTGTAYIDNFGVPAAAPWTPLELDTSSSLRRFFSAQDFAGNTDGDAISSWNDQSSQNQDATQGTGGNQPTKQTRNGEPTVYFDGTDDYLSMASTGLALTTGASTVFVVGHHAAGGSGIRAVVSIGNASAGQLRSVGGSFSRAAQASCNGLNNDHISAVSWTSTDKLVCWTLDPAVTSLESQLNIDGGSDLTFDMSGTAINTATTTAYIGQRAGNTDRWFGGIQCVVILNRVISQTEREKLEGWAAWEFNLVSLLPGGHPYKSAAPTV